MKPTSTIVHADAIEFLESQPADSLDLVFGSPPYEEARLYLENGVNMGISRKTEDWVAWMVKVFEAAQCACKGLVAFVVAGQTRNYRWSAGPALLAADLHRAGFNLRNPALFSRIGIPGSGGPDWLRSDYEWIICTTRPGKLPWSDNTAMGHAPKWAQGGEMSHRLSDGTRTNQWGKTGEQTAVTGGNGEKPRTEGKRPSHKLRTKGGSPMDSICERNQVKWCGRRVVRGSKDGDTITSDSYEPPVLANPGNEIQQTYQLTMKQLQELLAEPSDMQRHLVGGGVMGDKHCHENEAPFPEKLAEFFVRSFCRPGGTACDPFSGSGTTAKVSVANGRNFIGCDLRQSQVDLGLRRLSAVTPDLFAGLPLGDSA